jgi:glycosyltransferase involved in cell wall biosynthesis
MRVTMLLHKSVEHDARVRREARALAEAGHEVTVVHLPRGDDRPGEAASEGYELVSANPGDWAERLPGGPRRAVTVARIARLGRGADPDVVHAHDAAMLAPGWTAARGAGVRLLYDSHELATGVPYHSGSWAVLVRSVERLFVPRCAAVITVSDGIAERLRERYDLERLPTVVRNIPDLPPPRPEAVADLRAELSLGDEPLAIHHGAVAVDRGGENLIRSLAHLDRGHLLFLGASGPYAERLKGLAAGLGLSSRVHMRPPAPLSTLLSYTAQVDAGVTLLEDTCLNHRLALPNKVFEYIAAGIPVVASDLPELRRMIDSYGVGFTVDAADPKSIASGLRSAFAARAEAALRDRLTRAGQQLTWSRERERLLALYERLGMASGSA